MEPKFRPIPITILDFMAVLLPGFVWLALIIITLQLLITGESKIINDPSGELHKAATEKDVSWLPVILSLAVISLLIGYSMKPIAMVLAGWIARYFFFFTSHRSIPFKELNYPFKAICDKKVYYGYVCSLIEDNLISPLEGLPGRPPFSAAKRYLRQVSPALWEESERMEAEVRMTGALLLASFYSLLLSLIVIIFHSLGRLQNSRYSLLWGFISLIMTFISALSFNRLRVREVEYTYLNALIASKFKPTEEGSK